MECKGQVIYQGIPNSYILHLLLMCWIYDDFADIVNIHLLNLIKLNLVQEIRKITNPNLKVFQKAIYDIYYIIYYIIYIRPY